MPIAKSSARNITLTPKVKDLVKSFLVDRVSNFPRTQLRAQLEKLDKYYHMQSRRDPENADFNSRYQDIDIGIVNPTAETDFAFYVDTYLTSAPIFSGVSSPDNMDVAKAVEIKIQSDDMTFSWRAELAKMFRNIAKHNKGLLECVWEEDLSYEKISTLDNQGQLSTETVVYAGNKLRSLSLYNSFWDHTVSLANLARKGEFAGYVDRITYLELATLADKWGLHLTSDVWASTAQSSAMIFGSSATNDGKYYWPDFFEDEQNLSKEMDWMEFLGRSTASEDSKYKDAKRHYELHVFYVRTIPSMLNISVPNPNKPQVFRMVVVNGYIVQIYHMDNFHNRLPIFGAQVIEDDVELLTQGPAQLAMVYQELMKQIADRQLAILDRLISDRGLYDPQLVDSESISSPVPDAKIPARPSAKDGLAGAYSPIPYNPSGFFELGNMMVAIKSISDEATGINQAQRGNFVQGNKTLGEWQDVMAGANSKPFSRAMVLESAFFVQLQMAIKSNMFQYQTDTVELYSESDRSMKRYDPAEVRQKLIDIKLTNGLNSAAKLLKTGGLEYMLQMLMQFQGQIGLEFDIASVFSHLLMQGKGVDIRDYKLSPEQKSQMIAAQNAGTSPATSQQNQG